MGITVIPGLFDEGNPSAFEVKGKLVGAVRETGKYYRHPDSARITYPLVVANPIGSIPSGKEKIKIAIIGGGVAGIASCYELSRLGNSDRLDVTLYESDPDHFTSDAFGFISLETYGKKAGRVFAAQSYGETDSDRGGHTVYEIGAMRFPEIAGLTWHYAGVVYGNDKPVDVFPNPGKVPTEFVFGNRSDRYYSKGEGMWLDKNSPTKLVAKLVRAGIFGGDKDSKYPRSYFLIGDKPNEKQPSEIAAELKNPNTKPERLEQIQVDWKAFAKKYDNLTLESAVRHVIRTEVEKDTALLPDIAGLSKGEDKIDYYAELFGCFGFGTGGFKPIQNTSLAEMMRLLLWDYSNEYILPKGVNENVDFIKKLYQQAIYDHKLIVHVKRARVCDVCHSANTGKALVFSYDVSPEGQESTGPPDDFEFDYVILAVTPKQMHSMISRAGFGYEARNVRFGDYGRQSLNDTLARPPLILSKKFDAPNSLLFSAINQVHMVSSSKVFVTIKEEDLNNYAPKFFEEGKIKSVVSDCGLASSYFVPSPLLDQQHKDSKDGKKYYSLLLSYTWEEDTKRMQHHLYEYPINRTAESAANKQMIEAAINRTIRVVKNPETNAYEHWWFGELLSKSELSDALSYDWTTGYSAGGFKLDTTGCNYNSSLCFRYHTHALDWSSLENRFFIAGDSYSHLGGWVEGAFISAVNAVTGLVVAANNGKIDLLSEEAKKVINSLDRVVLPQF